MSVIASMSTTNTAAERPSLGRLGSGELVRDRFNSHLHDGVVPFLSEAFSRIESEGRGHIDAQVDFGRIIGVSTCVATVPGDEIVYAQRANRRGLTRFVKKRQPEPCSSVVVILVREDGRRFFQRICRKITRLVFGRLTAYVLITAFMGELTGPEPWDPRATVRSRKFWNENALVWGSEVVVPGTDTTVCPW